MWFLLLSKPPLAEAGKSGYRGMFDHCQGGLVALGGFSFDPVRAVAHDDPFLGVIGGNDNPRITRC